MTLKKTFGLWDLISLNIVAIVGLRWLSYAASSGYAALILWVLAFLAFFLPQAFCVAVLTFRYPEEGGLYTWTQRAFGEGHGFLCGWCYWINNLFYFPSLLLFTAGTSAYMVGANPESLEENKTYVFIFSMVTFSIVLILCICDVGMGKWIQNLGGISTWLPVILLLLGASWVVIHGQMESYAKWKETEGWSINVFSELCFAFAGLELASVMAGEIKNPQKNVPRAILWGGIVITAIYILGTLAILIVLPSQKVNAITGAINALKVLSEDRFGLPFIFASTIAMLMTIGSIGGLAAWLSGSSRIPFVAGLQKSMPDFLGYVHPKFGTPVYSLLLQGVLVMCVILISSMGSTIAQAYQVLVKATLIIYFVPYLYMFPAANKLGKTKASEDKGKVLSFPFGAAGRWFLSSLGFASTLLAIILAVYPPEEETKELLFTAEVKYQSDLDKSNTDISRKVFIEILRNEFEKNKRHISKEASFEVQDKNHLIVKENGTTLYKIIREEKELKIYVNSMKRVFIYEAKVVGGSIGFIFIGIILYRSSKLREKVKIIDEQLG